MERIVVVIPAAGIGLRMGLDLPKQFMSIDGRPVISHTVENFLRFKGISKIVVVASLDKVECMQHIMDCIPQSLSLDRIKVISGADSRHKSIYMGLQYLKNDGLCKGLGIADQIHPGFSLLPDFLNSR